MMYEVVRCGKLSVCKDDFKNSMTSDLVVQADVKDGPGILKYVGNEKGMQKDRRYSRCLAQKINTQTRGVDVGCERYRDNATTNSTLR